MMKPTLARELEQPSLAKHAADLGAEIAEPLQWLRDAWDDEEIIYDGEWDDLLRSGK
jgi:hypothetical protein